MSGKFGLASGKSQGNVREFVWSSLYEPCNSDLLILIHGIISLPDVTSCDY